MLVLDATPLIYLAKAGKVALLGDLGRELVLPASVYHEVVERGEARGEADASRIRHLVEDGTLRVVEVPSTTLAKQLSDNERLHAAERDVLVLAEAHDGMAILDERYGRSIAEAEGVEHGGTLYLLIQLVKLGAMTRQDARRTLDHIIEEGWYCSTNLYARILRALEKMGEDERYL